ncbi:MAG: LPS export ABC transporter periplasmic protein LptC [Marinomonas sp.]
MPKFESAATPKILLLATLLIAGVAVFLWHGTSPQKNLIPTDSLSSSPDYFITQVTIKEFNQNGELIETLNAKQTLHYVDDSKTLLDSPSVARKSESGTWSAKANKGIIHDGSNDILLTDKAEAVKTYLQSEDIKLSADSIHYLDKDQSLTSQGSPMLVSTQGETSADKITTYINSEKVIMTGSVRGTYETLD